MAICVGCGLAVNEDGVLTVDLATTSCLSCSDGDGLAVVTAPGGGLACTGSGLAISGAGGLVAISAGDSATIDMSGNGTSGSPLSAVVRKSSSGCNGLRLDGDGVWAPKACNMSGTDDFGYGGAIFPVSLNTAGAGLFTVGTDGSQTFNNTSDCELAGLWDVQAYGGGVEAQPGFDGYAYLSIAIDGGSPAVSVPETYFRMDNRASAGGDPNGGVVVYNINNLWERNWIHLNPGESHSFTAQMNIKVTSGTGTWYDSGAIGLAFPRFEFHWHFTVDGDC